MDTEPDDPVTEADLHAWMDGELPEERRGEVESHLAGNPDLARRFERYRAQRAMLQGTFGPLIDRPLPAALAPPYGRAPGRQAMRSRRSFQALAAAAVVLVFVAGGAGGWWLHGWTGGAGGGGAAFVADAVAAHRVFAVEVRHPVEVGADQEAHLVGWLSKRLGKPLQAPRLAGKGYDLVGGRLLSDARGPAAQLMYQDAAGRRITLYVRPASDAPDTSFRFAQDGNVQAFYWRDNGLAWAVTGDLDRVTLSAIAEEVYSALNS
ncbi:anti-sigma factor family protein [Azospirillum brasilense]|uniref:Transcriptional regulator n=1 Tax=Azospirillum brasilense TaxID=192 RepID=A0A235HGR5_AZOBR|nr:anti-sigma factor [Azospirillum brasilense]OYD84654.1 transcriptional regulator [Azospirillum brasilense]